MHWTAWGPKQAIQSFKLLVLQILESEGWSASQVVTLLTEVMDVKQLCQNKHQAQPSEVSQPSSSNRLFLAQSNGEL